MENYQDIHIEEDFWGDFILEAFEHIDEIETNAMSLDQNPDDMEVIHTMFRAFHTIKGLSGFVEHTVIQEIAHKTETLMDYCRKGELAVNPRIVDAILKSSDYIKRLCEDMDAFRDESLIAQIIDLLKVLEELAMLEPVVEEKVEIHVEQPEIEVEPAPEEIEAKKEEGLAALANEFLEFEPEETKEEVETETQVSEVMETPVEAHEEIQPEHHQPEEVQQEEAPVEVQEEVVETLEVVEEAVQPVVQSEEEVHPQIENEVQQEVQPEEIKAPEPEEKIETKTEEKAEEAAPKELTQEEKVLATFQNGIINKLKGAEAPAQKTEHPDAAAPRVAHANEEHMKVANYKIDHLVDMIGELIINQSLIEQYVALNYSDDKQLIANMSGFLRITRELQNLSMSLRMVSLKPTFQKISRIARDTIQELGKSVEFITSGDSTEIDRVVTDKLLDPLVHLIKNAISHGVEENSEDRVKIGKSPRAKVELNAYSKRGKIFIEVKDDGRGINTEIVYQKALEKGLIDPAKTYSDAEIKEFILLPGFSTAKVVDNISGRGVGMDVVKTQILKIGGKVDIQSTLEKGSVFTLEVPVNNAIMNGTIIELNNQHFVVPTINVKEFLKPSQEQWIFTKQQRTMIRVRDNIIPIVPISTFFPEAKEQENVPLVMILELDQELKAVPITNVLNRQEVVVKPVGEEFSHLKYISGMSILGTGKVSLILDIDYLFRKEIKE